MPVDRDRSSKGCVAPYEGKCYIVLDNILGARFEASKDEGTFDLSLEDEGWLEVDEPDSIRRANGRIRRL